ncbi:MAG: dihydroxy-acid dehydratase, partial [Pseudomonadota bacterium]
RQARRSIRTRSPLRTSACRADMLVDEAELAARAEALAAAGGYASPESQSPWQEIFRDRVGRFDEGMTLRGADAYRDIARKHMPRDNH